MIPLLLFLLGCTAVYVGTIDAAFSALMRLPLRLSAERHGRLERLGPYLDDPLRLFVPARLLQGLIVSLATAVSVLATNQDTSSSLGLLVFLLVVFVVTCNHLLPLLIVRRDPERVLELLLPSFQTIVRVLRPVTGPLVGLLRDLRRRSSGAAADDDGSVLAGAGADGTLASSRSEIDDQEQRQLIQSVVEFGDTRVREVMTPRPDIIAVKSDATLNELRNLFEEEQYSRLPVFKTNLDNILGFVFVKDLVPLHEASGDDRVIERIQRPAYVVPETKRVAKLLKEFQRKQVQSAIVHDEYGGTAGLVTIEDLLEEIVGEIRDEYDEETEPIVDEGDGNFVFGGRVSVDDVGKYLNVEIEPKGFETVAGYLLARLGRVPRVGESFDIDKLHAEVLEAERRRVHRVRLSRRPDETSSAARV